MTTDGKGADGRRLRYVFSFGDGRRQEFTVLLRLPEVTCAVAGAGRERPEWTRLDFCPCPHCPFDAAATPYCPVAVNLVPFTSFFRDARSYDEVTVHVVTAERTYAKKTTVQTAVSALVGVCMPTSGCPHLDPLRPMARFHLPLATLDETKYRMLSMYLLGQFLRYRRGLAPDWDMRGMVAMFEAVHTVNESFCRRLRSVSTRDANMNALVILDVFADSVRFSVDEGFMDDMETLFGAYFGPAPRAAAKDGKNDDGSGTR